MSIAHGLRFLVMLALNLAVVVVIASVVRRHRPDGYRPLLLWSIAALVWSLLGGLGMTVFTWLAGRAGSDQLLWASVVSSAVGVVADVVLTALFLYGLVTLARTPPANVRPPVR